MNRQRQRRNNEKGSEKKKEEIQSRKHSDRIFAPREFKASFLQYHLWFSFQLSLVISLTVSGAGVGRKKNSVFTTARWLKNFLILKSQCLDYNPFSPRLLYIFI